METGIHDLTAGYALDALDPEERRAYEAHLSGCARCQDELTSFWETTDALALAASGPEPSAELRARILAGARTEPQVVVPFESSRRRTVVPALAAVAAVAAVVALAVGLWASRLSSDLDDARAALERERAAAAVLADPGARTVALEAGQGRLVVAENGRAVLVLDGLDPAPPGKTYETWVIEGENALPAGLFPGSDGIDVVSVEGVVEPGDVVAVTIEDEDGAQVPSTDPIAASIPV
ncbi:MAG: anti-sigma factor domain-containing protein [Gaiellaceae bacterium]